MENKPLKGFYPDTKNAESFIEALENAVIIPSELLGAADFLTDLEGMPKKYRDRRNWLKDFFMRNPDHFLSPANFKAFLHLLKEFAAKPTPDRMEAIIQKADCEFLLAFASAQIIPAECENEIMLSEGLLTEPMTSEKQQACLDDLFSISRYPNHVLIPLKIEKFIWLLSEMRTKGINRIGAAELTEFYQLITSVWLKNGYTPMGNVVAEGFAASDRRIDEARNEYLKEILNKNSAA